MRVLIALLALLALTGARDPQLVPSVSQDEIAVRQGFTGTELLLFGAILPPEQGAPPEPYDVVVVLKGPTSSVVVREKQQVAGIWMNVDAAEFRSVPSFYAVASSREIAAVVDARTAAIYELGLPYLQLSPIGAIDPEQQARIAAGLVERRRGEGHYQQVEGGVQVKGGVLYEARFELPSSVETGTYTAETFVISRGRVLVSEIARVEVRKVGFEKRVADYAENEEVWYGLFAVFLSIFMGWAAGRLFALV
ncbi:hypothetical protein GCM10010923_05160 [Blastomonas marina]|uniref:TIGR02186 family protein n=1 Tax=Blastomonas marina TaxID=1867408 RepID=A0ABQ1F4I1_9SPHN|nr:TIGR02186 family protein [Blastomonas marina]GFZ99732.1 hypothetical protein GCM10010923_05160 [Blastomonas marina]